MTPGYVKFCVHEECWSPSLGMDTCHLRALPTRLPVKGAEQLVVYITGIAATKVALREVLNALGIKTAERMQK